MANEKLTSNASVGSPSATDFKVSTVKPGSTDASSEVMDLIASDAKEAATDNTISKSEVQDSLSKFLGVLASNAVIKEDDPIVQMSEASPAIGVFVSKLQESIFEFKESTPQGFLLKTQLENGVITEEQFKSSIQGIPATAEQAQAAVAGVISNEIQQLLLSLSSDKDLKVLETLISTKGVNPDAIGHIEGPVGAAVPELGHLLDIATLGDKTKGTNYQTDNELALINLKDGKYNNIDTAEQSVASGTFGKTVDHIITRNTDDILNTLLPQSNKPWTGDFLPDTTDNTKGTEIKTDNKITILEAAFGPTKKLITKFADKQLGFFRDMIKLAAEVAERNLKTSASALLTLNPQPRIMTGARAIVKINGLVAALCVSVSYEISTGWEEIRGVDELIPNDLSPTSYSVKGSMTLYRVPNGSPVELWLQQDMFRGVIWPYSTIEIRDKRTDELVMLVKRAAITSRSEFFVKGQLTTSTLGFVGIGFRDEKMPELLPDALRNILIP